MAHRFDIDADLTFSMQAPDTEGGKGPSLSGTVTGSGRHLELRSDDVGAMSSGASLGQARAIAAELAKWGLTVTIAGPDGPVVSVGAVTPNRFTRLLTRSKYIRVEDWRQATALKRSVGGRSASLLPPSTPWPPAPTFKYSRRRLTTTHDPDGGGRPRFVLAMGEHAQSGGQRRVFPLSRVGTTFGSAAECDVQLAGIDQQQAQVRRDPHNDEYVLVNLSDQTPCKFNGGPLMVGEERPLRTGSRVQLGKWTLTYTREEYADHGRPYGGRAGGEFSEQLRQPPPKYTK